MMSATIPAKCEVGVNLQNKECPPNSYVIMADFCEFIDHQTMKLQECPEAVPTGEMPRSITLSGERQEGR